MPRRNRNRLLRGRSPYRGGGATPLTLRQKIGSQLGAPVNVFADARELDLDNGDPVTEFGDWTMVGSPFGPALYDADGWDDSLPLVDLTTDEGSADDWANYEHGTPFIWAFSGVITGTGATRMVTLDSAEARRLFYYNTNNGRMFLLTRNDAGTSESESGSEVELTGLAHVGCAFDGSSASIAIVDSGGATVSVNASPVDTAGPSTYAELVLGNQGSETCLVGLTSLTRCSPGAATLANLQAVLNLHNEAYPV